MARIKTGIKVLDSILRDGFPRNSFVLVSGEGGTGKSVILYELLYRRLKMEEPAIFVCFDDTPKVVIKNMSRFGWNLKDYCKSGMLKFLDCFSFRMDSLKEDECSTLIKNPCDLNLFTDVLISNIKNMDMDGKGIVILDSLTEYMTISDIPSLVEFIKNWKAKGCRERNITFFTSIYYGIQAFQGVTEVLDYIVDGVIDLRFEPNLMQNGVLLKQMRVRKMKGVSHHTSWVAFTITKNGVQKFDVSKHG